MSSYPGWVGGGGFSSTPVSTLLKSVNVRRKKEQQNVYFTPELEQKLQYYTKS